MCHRYLGRLQRVYFPFFFQFQSVCIECLWNGLSAACFSYANVREHFNYTLYSAIMRISKNRK